MTINRPSKRYTVIVRDGNDGLHVSKRRAHDVEHAKRLAVDNVTAGIEAIRGTSRPDEYTKRIIAARALRKVEPLYVFIGHIQEATT